MEDESVQAINKEDITRYDSPKSRETAIAHDTLSDYLETPGQDWFDQKMDQVSKLRHEDRDAAREVISEIKQELEQAKALQERGAYLQDMLIAFMMENPDASKEQVTAQFADAQISEYEKQRIVDLYGELHARREASQRVIDEYRTESAKELHVDISTTDEEDKKAIDQFAARKLFHAFSGQTATGEVNLVDTPFAVGIEANSDDIRTLRRGGESYAEGFYSDGRSLKVGQSRWSVISMVGKNEVPLIGVTMSDQKDVSLVHEINHGISKAVRLSLDNRADQAAVWGTEAKQVRYDRLHTKARNAIEKSLEQFKSNRITQEEFENSIRGSMGLVVGEKVAKAKEEVISDFEGSNNFDYVRRVQMLSYDQSVHNTDKHYQYFEDVGIVAERFGFSQEAQDVYDKLADEYNQILQDSVSSARETWDLFRNFGMDEQKKGELTALLRQSPLSTWNKRISFYYKEDRRELKSLLEKAMQLDSMIVPSRDTSQFINNRARKLQRQLQAIQERGQQVDGPYVQQVASLLARNDSKNTQLVYLFDRYRDDKNGFNTYDKEKVESVSIDDIQRNANPIRNDISQLQAELAELTAPINQKYNQLYDQS